MGYIPLPPSGSRQRTPAACLNYQPGPIASYANVSAVRADATNLADLCAQAAALFAERGRNDYLWYVGPRTTPSDAVDALVSLGAEVVSACTAMLLDHQPVQGPAMDVREVETPEDLLDFRRIGLAGLGDDKTLEADTAELASSNTGAWADFQSYAGRRRNFLAYINGTPVAAGGLLLTDHAIAMLSGGATLPSARRQGCYRALVHARWVAAANAGAGPLLVQASPMFAPILAATGFKAVAAMTLLRQTTSSAQPTLQRTSPDVAHGQACN